MDIWLEDFKQNATIAGFKHVRISDVNRFFHAIREEIADICMQFFDASLVAGTEHLRFAALNALNAFKCGVNISGNVAMEMLLYASARYQIKDAVKSMGVKSTTDRIAVLILTESSEQSSNALRLVSELLGGEQDDSVVDLTNMKMKRLLRFFRISKTELKSRAKRPELKKEALIDLIVEHMALLGTQR